MTTTVPTSNRRAITAVLALLMLVVTAACGASGSDDNAAPSTTKAPPTTDRSDSSDDPDGTDTTEASSTSETEQTTETTGGGKASGTEQEYIDALVGSFDPEKDGEDFTKDQVACLADGWVRSIGVGAFQKAGLSPDDIKNDDGDFDNLDLSEAQAEKMVDVYDTCGIDIKELMLKSFASDSSSPKQQACIEKALTDDAVRALLVQSIVDEPKEDNPVMQVLTACMAGG